MSNRGYRGGVQEMGVGEHRPCLEKTGQPGIVVSPEAQQVIVAELVDHDCQYQAGLSRGRLRRRPKRACNKKRKD